MAIQPEGQFSSPQKGYLRGNLSLEDPMFLNLARQRLAESAEQETARSLRRMVELLKVEFSGQLSDLVRHGLPLDQAREIAQKEMGLA